MWNKFRLWFNKNDYKIFFCILIIIIFITIIKSSNNYFREIEQQKNGNSNKQNLSIFNDVQYSEDDLIELNSSQDDYKTVKSIVRKFINSVYNATVNNDETLRQNVINMCSKRFIESLTIENRTITTENILKYVSKIYNVNYYTIGRIYRYGEKNHISEYVINLKYDDGTTDIVNSYMVIYLDKNNGTFSFDGEYMKFEFINKNEEYYEPIEKNGSNVYK